MAFYIKPPDGIEKLQNLTLYGKKRLRFLQQVLRCDSSADFRGLLDRADTAADSECLIEGTTKDRVSHFLLRLACCQDSGMTSFFVRAETELFCHRFACMSLNELVHLFQSTYRFLCRLCRRHCQSSSLFVKSGQPGGRAVCSSLLQILKGMIADGLTWEGVVDSYLEGCSSEVIRVPFEYALPLVASRSVVLERGVAMVPPADILKVLAALFKEVVANGVADARQWAHDVAASDERMVELFRGLRRLYYSGSRFTEVDGTPESSCVASEDIDKLSACFPPCMQHLHSMLRKKHRLRHFSRIQYTLYLKEVGLPVSEAVKFWQSEYSQPDCHHGNSAGCTHTWQRDGRRYTYSIRHLYGLEGSKVNYKAHSCHSIQERSIGHGEEGGCPFRHFDDEHLGKVMSEAGIKSEEDATRITDLTERGETQAACQTFFRKSVAASLAHFVKSNVPDETGSSNSDQRAVDDREVDVEDADLQPCSEKKPRHNTGDVVAPAGDGRGNKRESSTPKHSAGTSDAFPSPSASQASDTGLGSRDAHLRGDGLLFTVTDEATLSTDQPLTRRVRPGSGDPCSDAQGEFSATTLPPPRKRSDTLPVRHQQNNISHDAGAGCSGDSKSDGSSEVCEGVPSPSATRTSISPSNRRQTHRREQPKTDSGSHRRDSSPDEQARSSSAIAILRDVQIHKPVDYYRSYLRLLASLQQHGESNSS